MRTLRLFRIKPQRWLALGLHRRRPPHMLSTQPYPMQPDGDWADRQVLSFKVRDA